MIEQLRGGSKTLRLGIIGMSEGNGHPYSWAAIFNGFDPIVMAKCPFPGIPAYLSKEHYPDAFLNTARVTHVWTQDHEEARHIAAASRISTVAETPEAMLGEIDGLLLARDDSSNHLRFAKPFLEAGIPVYVDKPLATSKASAETLLALAGDTVLFSCSALRYAEELRPTAQQRAALGEIRFIDARVPKYWDTYAVHVIEPVLLHFPEATGMVAHEVVHIGDTSQLTIRWESGLITRFSSLGAVAATIGYTLHGDGGSLTLDFKHSFFAFRAALDTFVGVMKDERPNIPRDFTMRVIDVLELGSRS